MSNIFILTLLLIYFWYFYYNDSKLISSPRIAGPVPASPFHLTYTNVGLDSFQFSLNGTPVWKETVPSYLVTADAIQQKDDCYASVQNGQKIPARGLGLYTFVKKYPKFESLSHRSSKDNGFIFQHGTPFYFTCENKTVAALTLCPTGHIFLKNSCKPINSCTGQLDQTRLPHPDIFRFIECLGGEQRVRQCPPGQMFYGGHCASEKERLCIFQRDLDFFKLDDTTLMGCRNHTPVYKKCPPGTQLFENTFCEPSDCVGKADFTKIPLRKRKRGPFEYSPGYSVCKQGKIAQSVDCPSTWNPMLAKQENLTLLPMVFHVPSSDCSEPFLCENVWPTEPDIYVPVHEFTRKLQNWSLSKLYDHQKGYICDNKGIKKEFFTEIGTRINDHYKIVPACNDFSPPHLPLYQRMSHYLDCIQNNVETCPKDEFFNGTKCIPIPDSTNVFKYNQYLPLFQFDSLQSDGWIAPFTKKHEIDKHCDFGFQHLKQYNICSDPSCVPFAFLFMIPQLALFLEPTVEKAQCQYDVASKHIRKTPLPLSFHYTFWDQQIQTENTQEKPCQFGQHLKTGNYIWDRTIYATCDKTIPFIFCPSPHTNSIYQVEPYACNPPRSTTLLHRRNVDNYTQYPKNLFKRVRRVDPNKTVSIILNKSDTYKEYRIVPPEGLEIPDGTRVNIKADEDVFLEYKYRLTFPPHAVFRYENGQRIYDTAIDPSMVFNLNSQSFEHGKFEFPKYQVKPFVELFNDAHHYPFNR